MNADLVTNRGRSLLRSNSVRSINGRNIPGGAPERVARRRLERLAGDGGRKAQTVQRGRSRSRSRSRNRLPRENNNVPLNRGRSRSRSRSRARQVAGAQKSVPIQARLGLRKGANKEKPALINRRQRNASVTRRGVQQGRITKNNVNGTGGAQLRGRSRSRVRQAVNANGRSRSGMRRGSAGQQQHPQKQVNGQQQTRSRSQSKGRRNGRGGGNQMQLRNNGRKNTQQKTGKNTNASNQGGVPRRGRSRSRGMRNGARNLGTGRGAVKKEDLDKELDQYMSTTKVGDMDYLLK